jgi:hypothetical protein
MSISLARFAARKTTLALVLISIWALSMATIEPVCASEDVWESKAPMHVARSGLGVAVVNGKIYGIGGSTESGTDKTGGFVGTNEEYDPTTDKWTLKASMPTPRRSFAIASHEGKIYCIGGIIDYNASTGLSITDVNEVYDPATDTWSRKASLPTARSWAIAVVLGSRIYLFGGDPDKKLNQVYDTETDSWTTMSSIPTPVTKAVSAAVLVDKTVLVVDKLGNLEIYDSEADTWEFGPSPPSQIVGGDAGATTGAFALKRAYFLGLKGFMDQGAMPNRIYDPKAGSWTVGAPVPTNRLDFGVAVVNDILYVIGGRHYTFLYPADSPYIITQSAANEAYMPIGYGTPDPDYTPPTPTPTPILTDSPSPTQSSEPQQLDHFPITWIAVAVPAAVITIILLIYLKKRRY